MQSVVDGLVGVRNATGIKKRLLSSMPKSMSKEVQMKQIIKQLLKTDPTFKAVVKDSPLCDIGLTKPKYSHFETLTHSIISQMIATKAAATISNRLITTCNNKVEAKVILKLGHKKLQAVGLSNAKTAAILDLAELTQSNALSFERFNKLSNAEIEKELIQVKGIGSWTAQMFLIFHLGRLDIWPILDLGVRRGWMSLHKLRSEISPAKLATQGQKFAGYESVVAWYCWKVVDG